MRARNALRLLLIVLAGTLALPLVASVVALRGPATVSRAADGDPTVIATISVGDHPCGVALNPNSNRIYVPNHHTPTVSVIDGASNTVVATVAVGSNPCGVAVNPNTNRIYVANWDSGSVSVIDGASNTVVATVAGGTNPYGVANNPNSNRIYVANLNSANVSVVDGASNAVIATVAVGNGPYGVAVNPNSNRIYVPNFADDTVSVIEDIVPPTPVPSTPTAHPGVGGKVLLPPAAMATESRASTEDSGWSAGAYSALAVVGTAVAVAGGAWYARRRWRAG